MNKIRRFLVELKNSPFGEMFKNEKFTFQPSKLSTLNATLNLPIHFFLIYDHIRTLEVYNACKSGNYSN